MIGQFENIDYFYWLIFWTDSDLFAAGVSVTGNCEIQLMQSSPFHANLIFAYTKVHSRLEKLFCDVE